MDGFLMMGYTKKQSCLEMLEHGKLLDAKVDKKYQREIQLVYSWITHSNFLNAMDYNTVESWKWLHSALEYPPKKVLNMCASTSTRHSTLLRPTYSLQKQCDVKCRLCSSELASSIVEKVKFSVIICKCEKIWCHQDCAETFLTNHAQCNKCKQYFILAPCCSSIRSTFLNQKDCLSLVK